MKLAGVKVLDLSAFLPGPHLTMTMADHGADVVMIEPANGVGEPTREIGWKDGDGVSIWFRNIARGKRSLKLNLKDPEGLALFMRLAESADVVVEAFRPGVTQRLGVDYDSVAARNPGVIYCSISAFGQQGVRAGKPAHDVAIQGLAGLVDLNRGLEDGKPAMPNLPAADMAASLTGLAAIAMALFRRAETGRGDYIDLSMHDCLLAWTVNVVGPVFAAGQPPEPKEMRSFGGAAMYNLYETADGQFLILGGSEPKFADNLLEALGRADLAPLARLEPGPGQGPLRRFFRETFAREPLAHWQAFLKDIDCCWSHVRSLKEAFEDPETAARGMLLHDPTGRAHIGPAIRYSNEPAEVRLVTPGYGADGAALAREAGLAEEKILELKQRGVM